MGGKADLQRHCYFFSRYPRGHYFYLSCVLNGEGRMLALGAEQAESSHVSLSILISHFPEGMQMHLAGKLKMQKYLHLTLGKYPLRNDNRYQETRKMREGRVGK